MSHLMNATTAEGADHIEFRVTTNPGQPLLVLKLPTEASCHVLRWRIQVITARRWKPGADFR